MGRIPGIAESECIELFRRILGTAVVRRHTFDFLRGDPTRLRPNGVKLPVDAYFPSFSLVVEYMGAQHAESNDLMDRRPGRRQQRSRYQERRSTLLAEKGIRLIRIWHNEVLDESLAIRKLLDVGISPPNGGSVEDSTPSE